MKGCNEDCSSTSLRHTFATHACNKHTHTQNADNGAFLSIFNLSTVNASAA